MARPGRGLATITLAVLLTAPAVRADIVNFDLSGKIYMKYMYQNDNTQGCLSISNPFWVDNIGGHNGVCSEFELTIKGNIGPKVTAGVRLQSRWGMLWQDWWENGDLRRGVVDTSGESLGQNHAQYIKLRSAWIRFGPPIPTVKWITVGSTDYSMWNDWTIGKARYIDRDNGNGVFIEGAFIPENKFDYTVGAMALPKLWAGPGWNTGLKDNEPLAYLYGTDWAFAMKLESRPYSDLRLRAIGTWTQDWEADRYSPFLTGSPDAARCDTVGCPDHSSSKTTRFRGVNATLEGFYTPSWTELFSLSALGAYSNNYVNPNYATNLVRNGQGFSPVVFKTDANGNPIASTGWAGKVDLDFYNPFKIGLSPKFEYFNIGSEYNAIMGSRREADVLLTDGIITGGFTRGGQLPTLNVANEFQDWDEAWYESCIGWHGFTFLLEEVLGSIKLTGEYSYIGYNTNMQNRDTTNQYPDFLYTHGFTDTTAFTADADYANVYDRGKDPRSVYDKYQSRSTQIGVLTAQIPISVAWSPLLNFKVKYIYDRDNRNTANAYDDYIGRAWLAFGQVTVQPNNELTAFFGYEYAYWSETGRNGSEAAGYYPTRTQRQTARLGFTYAFGGVLAGYTMEWFHKNLLRDPGGGYYNMIWNVWRAKATIEVAW
ncbi:MAG: hypothetical protein ACXWLG_03950 [Myxococcaceae bacterium]